ncbi:MAG: hypothetical protein QOH90_1552 [Actinomycetota bacterium]|nr:hypothetical protein [Actinomycetota bacterium]
MVRDVAGSNPVGRPKMSEPHFFKSPAEFRRWLDKNHAAQTEVWVGFYKKATGKPTMTWSDAVDQALCYGWIDGVRYRHDDESYRQRFTPRTARSTWSSVNVAKVAELKKKGLMKPAGLAAFEARRENKTGIYSYENRPEKLPAAHEKVFKKDKGAWKFFEAQARSYRRAAIWWVISAKKEETRKRRLASLISDSGEGRRVKQFVSPSKRT